MTKLQIQTKFITLQQFLKFAGALPSGGEAKERIQSGAVTVNGAVCTQRGKKLYGTEIVALDGAQYEVIGCVSDRS